jgi:hypothetical protein
LIGVDKDSKPESRKGRTMYSEIEKISEYSLLRDINIEGYRLVTYDTGKRFDTGQYKLGYYFFDRDGSVLFQGEDYGCSPLHYIDSDESIRGLLGFLTLKPGDTDEEYFDNYTDKQLDFANSEAEQLSEYSFESGAFGEDYEPPELIDWEE